MTDKSIYKEVLMDHYRNPRNKGDLAEAEVVRRGSNPRCGDEIEVGVNFDNDKLDKVMFRGRGCSVCLASASMMTEAASGKSKVDAHQLVEGMRAWFNDEGTKPAESLEALDAVRGHSARKRCVLLAWEALDDALRTK
jgi:nitrogen fixation NifU-like protein